MKKFIKLIFPLTFISIFLLSSNTNAKYWFSLTGVAWQTHITEFSLLKDIFFAEEDKLISENLWGPEHVKDDTTTPSGSAVETGEIYTFIKDKVGEVTIINRDGNDAPIDLNNAGISGYLLNSLNDVELNVQNKTDKKLLISFDICYYAPKMSDFGNSKLFFSVYNSYLYPQTDNTVAGSDNLLYGEFVVNPHDRISDDGSFVYSTTFIWTTFYKGVEEPSSQDNFADAFSARIGDAENNGFKYNGKWYHCHKAQINPYGLIKSNSSIFGSSSESMSLLNSFILEPNNYYSYNCSVFYNTFGVVGNLNNYPASFYTSVKIVTRPVEYTVSFMNSEGNLYDFTSINDSYNTKYKSQITLSEGSFFNNYGIAMPDLTPNIGQGVRIGSSNPMETDSYLSDWVYYTKDGAVVDKGTAGAIENDFTYFTKVTQDMKVYSKS